MGGVVVVSTRLYCTRRQYSLSEVFGSSLLFCPLLAATVPDTSAADAVVLALAELEEAAAAAATEVEEAVAPLFLLPPLLAAPVFAAALAVTVTVVGAGHDEVDA